MSRTVLITGAAGRIGSALVKYLDSHDAPRYAPRDAPRYALRLADLEVAGERGVALDVTDLSACRKACEGIDTVVHLAAVASPDAPFDEILPVNISGTYNVFRAASDAGVRRVVFASSAQAIEGYPLDVQVSSGMPVRPKNIYGVSKAFGEALAAHFAYQQGLEAVAVRIGAFEYPHEWKRMGARDLSAWVSPEDLCALLVRCIEADLGKEPFAIAHGISDNRFKRLDLTDTRARLGYAPTADAFAVWQVGLCDTSEPVG
ncbi:NAD(P)-dependent oxidoreductase [Ramlibacter sp.]|uniref:NAD-dependent epimerase/dehydratase family protein n=1 Tax=Ramlibacter sp. TaxID=1917967 RepID=UPI0017DF6697|nr:NAD(P)-dependent oxidoreductase [Ramlibacter sp.]MBA2673531.1 NAD(P)-dependent oxidoreductase [Ramlibacter sp.]